MSAYIRNGGDGVDHVLSIEASQRSFVVARYAVGDVRQKLGEVGRLEDLIGREERDD